MRTLKWLLVASAAGYVALIAFLYAAQGRLLYPVPQKFRTAPAAADFPQAQEIVLDTVDGEKVIVWHVPPKGDKPVVLFFHGNGDILAWRAPRFRKLVSDGTGLVALSFRGYAGSTGSPSEDGLLADGEAAYQFAAARYRADQLTFWGYSLGSGVAVALAATHPVAKIVLEAPYTSVVDVAASMFPFAPVQWLVRDRFRSDQRIAKVTAPLLVIHGERDQAIAFSFGKKLFDLAPGRKRLVRIPEGRHENLDEHGVVETVQAFLAE